MHGLQTVLQNELPDRIVVTDFFQLYFWQCIRFVKRNQGSQLFLYSETKQLPNNGLSRLAMLFFLWRLRHNQKYIQSIFVFTEQGRLFFKSRFPETQIVVIPNPIDTDLFYPQEKVALKDDVLHILMVARYVGYKRHKDVLDAVVLVKEQGKKVKVTFVGKTGDDKESIRAYVKDIGLENVVTFLDPVPEKDMQKLYTSHDVLVLPSYNEAIGLAVPEAMACGLPTITSDTVGANVYVKKDVTGYIYVTYNVKELAECIVKIHNRERIIAMGQAARAQVLGFSIKNGVSTFLKAIA
jgi:glycosyltransferase involved in cell wall biosynthesis